MSSPREIERLAREAATRASPPARLDETLRAVYEALGCGIVVEDVGGCVVYVNQTAETLLGLSMEQLRALPCGTLWEMVSPALAGQTGIEAPPRTALRTQLPVRGVVLPIQRPDGEQRWLQLDAVPVRGPGDTLQTHCSLIDVTERQHARGGQEPPAPGYRSLAAALPQIVWTAGPGGAVDYCNPRWYDYTGLTPEQSLGIGWQRAIHPDDLPRCTDRWLLAVHTGRDYEVECRYRRADGVYRWHLVRAIPLRDATGQITAWIGTSTDIDDQKRNAERQRFLAEASALLDVSLDYEETLRRLARLAVPALADWCFVDTLDANQSIRRLAVAHADPAKAPLAQRLREGYLPRPDAPEGIPRVLRSGQAELHPRLTDAFLQRSACNDEHLQILRAIGYTSGMMVPLIAHGRILGAITLCTAESGREYGPDDLAFAEELAGRAALAVDNARLYQAEQELRTEAEVAQRRFAFLAEAGALLASSLDLEATLQRVVRLAVPFLADFCVLDLAEAGRIRRVAAAHADPAKEPLLAELQQRFSPELDSPNLPSAVLRVGRSRLISDLTDEILSTVTQAAEHAALIRALGSRSVIGVPLSARDQVFGVLTLVVGDSGRRYGEAELVLAEELAHRAAQAIDTARLVRETRKSEREARALYQAALAIGGELDLGARLERVLEAAKELTGAEYSRVMLVDPSGREIEVVATRGMEGRSLGSRQPVNAGLSGLVIALDRPARSEDQLSDPRTWDVDTARQFGLRSWLGVPLAEGGHAFGLLVVESPEPNAFTDDHERLLVSLAALASAAVREARLYRQAHEAVRVRDEFLATVSHDLNNPLTIIKGRADLLRRRARRDSTRQDELPDLDAIDRQVDTMRRLLGQLLDASRLEMGQELELRLREVDLAALARRLGEQYRATTNRHEIRIQVRTAEPVVGRWDPDRLEQIVGNLLSNAIKYSPRGGAIEVVVDREADLARLAVRDEGVGIPAEALSRLFQPFYRANATSSVPGAAKIRGLGLGLFSSYRLAMQHGGRIIVQSRVDQGSTFTLELPLAPRRERGEPIP